MPAGAVTFLAIRFCSRWLAEGNRQIRWQWVGKASGQDFPIRRKILLWHTVSRSRWSRVQGDRVEGLARVTRLAVPGGAPETHGFRM